MCSLCSQANSRSVSLSVWSAVKILVVSQATPLHRYTVLRKSQRCTECLPYPCHLWKDLKTTTTTENKNNNNKKHQLSLSLVERAKLC